MCKLQFVFLFVFFSNMAGIVGVLSGLIVFYWPKLRLPDSVEFQMFTNNHPFEIYDSQFKNMFWFEKQYTVREIIIAYFIVNLLILLNKY